MKITTALAAAVSAAGLIGVLGAPSAAADESTTTTIGNAAKLTTGDIVQSWTVSDLKASTDTIPYPVAGTLWEATATDQAVEGSATPIVSNLNARSRSGETYRVLFGVATPQGVNPSTLAQGEKTTGKVYFDVVGEKPDSVVYNAGGQDLLVWIEAPPAISGGAGYPSARPAADGSSTSTNSTSPTTSSATPTSSAPSTSAVPTPGAVAGAPAGSQGTPLAPGSAGTPLPAGSAGTPLATGSAGTPLPVGTEAVPQPAAVQEAPAPAGSQGTPLPASSPGQVAPTATATVVAPTSTTVVPPPA